MDCAAEAVRGPPDFPGVVLLPEVPDSFLFPITPTDPGWVEAMTEVESTLKVANIDCGTCGCIQKRVHFTGRTISGGANPAVGRTVADPTTRPSAAIDQGSPGPD
jgi:hypothetical protein